MFADLTRVQFWIEIARYARSDLIFNALFCLTYSYSFEGSLILLSLRVLRDKGSAASFGSTPINEQVFCNKKTLIRAFRNLIGVGGGI